MVEIKDNKKFDNISLNNFYVVADFDRTITTSDSSTTFSLFAKSGLYPHEYLEERNKLHNYYRPLELDTTITDKEKYEITKKWTIESYKLFLKYKIEEDDIKKILNIPDILKLRSGAIEFINSLNKNNIPLIINSAGIGNFIIELLKEKKCYSNNIFVYSNILEFRDGKIIDSSKEVIHSMNKYNIKLPDDFYEKISKKDFSVIIGDQLSDLNMSNYLPKKDIISFGFLESNIEENKELFYNNFDVVLTNNEGFNKIQKILKLR